MHPLPKLLLRRRRSDRDYTSVSFLDTVVSEGEHVNLLSTRPAFQLSRHAVPGFGKRRVGDQGEGHRIRGAAFPSRVTTSSRGPGMTASASLCERPPCARYHRFVCSERHCSPGLHTEVQVAKRGRAMRSVRNGDRLRFVTRKIRTANNLMPFPSSCMRPDSGETPLRSDCCWTISTYNAQRELDARWRCRSQRPERGIRQIKGCTNPIPPGTYMLALAEFYTALSYRRMAA